MANQTAVLLLAVLCVLGTVSADWKCHAKKGRCQNINRSGCSGGTYQQYMCNGPGYIQCCIPNQQSAPAAPVQPAPVQPAPSVPRSSGGRGARDFSVVPAPFQTSRGYGKSCNGGQGTCRYKDECQMASGYWPGQCGSGNPWVCCKPGTTKVHDDGTCGPRPTHRNWHAWGGKDFRNLNLCFPLRRGSLMTRKYKGIRWEHFGSARSSGKRCHAGVDIYTQKPGQLVAVDDGIVIKKNNFLRCKDGWSGPGMSILLLVYHPSLGVTINYGEIDGGVSTVNNGDRVKRGQTLGRAGHCGMLHFEVYLGKTLNVRWYPGRGITKVGQCSNESRYYATKPKQILDPRFLLEHIQCKYCDENGNRI